MSCDENRCDQCYGAVEPYCHVRLNTILELKDSTKKLLYLLEEIQTKTRRRNGAPESLTVVTQQNIAPLSFPLLEADAGAGVLRKLENTTKALGSIVIEDEDDDCSIYKRLTGKCHCLNQPLFNDFIIHFNEDTKYTTNNIGEIIKNMRILRRFLYMGGDYTKNALAFLNEGLAESQRTEKIEIVHGCEHADICNIFEEHSIVISCISWPCRYPQCGDSMTQAATAGLLFKLAGLEEGRRYLNYNSRITNDIKKVIRKRSASLETNTLESLNTTLNLLKPVFTKTLNVAYFAKSVYEGVGTRTINDLSRCRQHMTLEEVFMHLDLLNNFTSHDCGRRELMLRLPALLILFKQLLVEYDNSEMNIILTNILNNIVTRNMIKDDDESESGKGYTIADIATEPIQMKNQTCQSPIKKHNVRKFNKSKLTLGVAPKKTTRLPSKWQVSDWESLLPVKDRKKSKVSEWESIMPLNEMRKRKDLTRSVIIVPIENKKES